jgi:hypothetical protein
VKKSAINTSKKLCGAVKTLRLRLKSENAAPKKSGLKAHLSRKLVYQIPFHLFVLLILSLCALEKAVYKQQLTSSLQKIRLLLALII